MEDELKIKMYSFTVDCKDPYELAKFYAQLLGWEIPFHSEEYACIGVPGTAQGGYPGITFQQNSEYEPAGHPFCLCQMKSMMESACFALR